MPQTLRKALLCAPFFAAAAAFAAPLPAFAEDAAAIERGRALFTTEAEPQCAICHTLADAGATGAVGPNLDDLKPTESQVKAAVRSGVGVMPVYEGLSEEEIDALAQYLVAVTGS